MTLVVARVTPLGIRVAADMRLTDQAQIRRGFLHAALKVILLTPVQCAAYAGNVQLAVKAIRHISSGPHSREDAVAHLLEVNRSSGGETDFLLASLRPRRLDVIKDGSQQACTARWLGDVNAFADYQRFYNEDQFLPPAEIYDSPGRAADLEVAVRMGGAMHSVVDGPHVIARGGERTLTLPTGGDHASVGEAVVMALPRAEDNLFAYNVSIHAQAPPFPPPLPPGLGVVPPDFGSAAWLVLIRRPQTAPARRRRTRDVFPRKDGSGSCTPRYY